MEKTLRGQRNQCRGCSEYFNSNFAFDKHRTGSHHHGTRRCMTEEEMLSIGMSKRKDGFWVGEKREQFYESGS